MTEWTRKNRVYPASTDRPGPRDPGLTPYVIDYTESFNDFNYETSVFVCGSQMGKSEALLDVIGHQMDQRPKPILYLGPSQNFVTNEIEPRLTQLFKSSRSLSKKLAQGKKNKLYQKLLGGVPIRLAWAGSPSEVAGMAAKLSVVDEIDRMMDSIKGEGDPETLIEGRGFSFRDRKYGITSTPLKGLVETEKCEQSGLEFWKRMPPEDIESPVWQLWQQGTMYHWAWPCLHCETYFIPKSKHLVWPENATLLEARRKAHLKCPNCDHEIHEDDKKHMNARGVYVAPGQRVKSDGVVLGSPPESTITSFWVSGLCSPFVTFGERASQLLKALESGSPEKIQAKINTGFGELYAEGAGAAPEWENVKALATAYSSGEVPEEVVMLTAGIDVQKDRLIYVIRGWGARATSWLIKFGSLYGETEHMPVWQDLETLLYTPIAGHRIRKAVIDSGFRPGKKDVIPVNRVYEFCRAHKKIVLPSKGYDSRSTPLSVGKIDVKSDGKKKKFGLDLLRLDSDYYKSWVHSRIMRPQDELGAWFLPDDVTEDYCRQIVSEGRVKGASGKPVWVQTSKNNHFLDCEALAVAAGEMCNIYLIREQAHKEQTEEVTIENVPQAQAPKTTTSWEQISQMLG